MMKLIRNGVFETNSSSCHSLTIKSGGVYDTIIPNADGMIEIDPQDFGWNEETFTDPQTKLSYVYLYVRDWSGDSTESYMNILTDVVTEHTGAVGISVITEPRKYGWRDNGYIDHQSVEDRDLDYLFDDPVALKDFIFNSGSVLTTDNDNH